MRSLVSLVIILFLTVAALYTYNHMQSPSVEPPDYLQQIFDYVYTLFIRTLDLLAETLRHVSEYLSHVSSRR